MQSGSHDENGAAEQGVEQSAAEVRDFDTRDFRRALGQFATGIAVVTAQDRNGGLIGLTMSSFNSVSLEPPLVLFSIDRRAYSFAPMLEARSYGINLLSRAQRHLSDRFAKAQSDKWKNVSHNVSDLSAPLLHDALAHFECIPYARYDGGDHLIIVAEVVRYCISNSEREPLVFFEGHYRTLEPEVEPPPEWPLPLHYF